MTGAPLLEYPLENSQTEFHLDTFNDGRATRYQLRRIAARLLKHERVAGCGVRLVGTGATIVSRVDGGAMVSGVETCGSGWLCAVCSAAIAERRRKEVERACAGHTRELPASFVGPMQPRPAVLMATFTVPHGAFDDCRTLVRGVAGAWQKVQAGKAWGLLKAKYGILGAIRALEITHGKKGWHPHLHVLLFTRDLSPAEIEALGFALFDRWAARVERQGLGLCSEKAFEIHKCHSAVFAGDYVAKWGCDSELAKAGTKVARGENRTPWGLLVAHAAGDHEAGELFREYAMAIKGARRLTWSKGLKALYGVDEKTDEELAQETDAALGSVDLVTLTRPVWQALTRHGLVSDLLAAVEAEPPDIEQRRRAVLRFLAVHGINARAQ